VIDPSTLKGNISGYAIHQRGDIEQGFAGSDLVIENTYTTPFVHQAYLEPHGAIAQVDPDARITVWTTTQGAFITRVMLNQIFNLPLNKIRVIPTTIGGGFGGKAVPLVDNICILLAQKTNRPVKMIMSRKEEFVDSTPRHPSIIILETGVKKDGSLEALRSKVFMDGGAYAHMGPATAARAALVTQGPYRIPHIKLEGYCVYTNKVGAGAFRAPGFPQATFAIESQMDIIAEKIGIDPLEIRFKNGLGDGDVSFAGERLKKSSFHQVLKELAERVEWSKRKPTKNRGLGLACGQWNVMGMPASATIKVEEDGAVTVLTGTVDLTGSNTVFAQIVAEELKIPLGSIRVVTGDTDTAGFSPVSGGSMITYNTGNVVYLAAQDVRRQLFDLTSKKLDAKSEDMEIENGQVFVKGSPEKGLSIAQLSAISMFSGGGVIIGRGSTAPLLPHLVLCAQAAEVEVDPQTGQVTLISLIASQDVGFAINPEIVEGQIQGGVSQGAGFALSEKMVFDQGKVLNTTLAEYRIPTALDLPQIHTLLVEQPSDWGPFGVKGVGEPPTVPTAAAIANAIYNATGVRVCHLPISPEQLYQAIKASRPET
jgi:CO/xanthine dehydrogenase Mo-binding subunit